MPDPGREGIDSLFAELLEVVVLASMLVTEYDAAHVRRVDRRGECAFAEDKDEVAPINATLLCDSTLFESVSTSKDGKKWYPSLHLRLRRGPQRNMTWPCVQRVSASLHHCITASLPVSVVARRDKAVSQADIAWA